MLLELIEKIKLAEADVVNDIYEQGMCPDDIPSNEFNEMILDKINQLEVSMESTAYNTVEVEGKTYDDYALLINGKSFEVSVCRDDRKITVNKFGED